MNRRLTSFLTTTILGTFAVGCSTHRPDLIELTPQKETWLETSYSPEVTATLDSFSILLEEPSLKRMLEKLYARNYSLAAALARSQAARASVGVTAGSLYPQLHANSQYVANKSQGRFTPVFPGGGSGSVAAPSSENKIQEFAQLGLTPTWELDLSGALRAAVAAAEAEADIAAEDVLVTRLSLTTAVVTYYVQFHITQHRLRVAEAKLGALDTALAAATAKAQSGLSPQFDLNAVQADRAVAAAAIPRLLAAVRGSEYAIEALLGLQPGGLAIELQQSGGLPNIGHDLPISLPAAVLSNRPDVRRAERAVRAATARLDGAEAARYPSLTLSGYIGTQGEDIPSVFNFSEFLWNSGVALGQTIISGGRLTAQITTQELEQSAAIAGYQDTVLTAYKEVESALASHHAARQTFGETSASANALREHFDAQQRLYNVGMIDYSELLVSQSAHLEGKNALLQAQETVATSLIELYRAIGGRQALLPSS